MSAGRALLIGAEENPALPVLASLARAGVEVDAASPRRLSVGFFSRYARRRHLIPDPADEPAWLARLVPLAAAGRYDVILATGEEHTHLLAKHRARFTPFARVPLPDLPLFTTCRDKSRTMRAAARLGVPTPRTFDPESDSIESIGRAVGFPVVVKPNVSDGARGISYPRTPDELARALAATRAAYGECHVQEYIPHGGVQYKAEVLMDTTGVVRAWCVYSKIRYYPPSGGSSTLNRTVDRPDILETAARMLRGIGWHGMGDCDFIEDPRDGVPKLMEINPRFTRSIKICVRAGVDFPRLLYDLALDRPAAPVPAYRVGQMMRYLPADIAWFLRSPDRWRARPGFFRTFVACPTEEIFALADPGPFLAYLLASGLDLLHPARRRFRLRSGAAPGGDPAA